VRSFTDSDLPEADNFVLFINTTLIIKTERASKRMQSRLIRLIEVVFSKNTMLSVSNKYESVNERTHTDQQKIKFHILGVHWKCRRMN